MNRYNFKKNVLAVSLLYLTALFVALISFAREYPSYEFIKDLKEIIIAIPAAWLAYCFQRRQAYLSDVRSVWTKMVDAVQEAIQYTHLINAAQPEYGEVLRKLSIVIEELRAVFMNIGETNNAVGLFPFEGIKTIQQKISCLGFAQSCTKERATETRKAILNEWKEVRRHFLNEIDRGVPASADSRFLDS